MESIPQDEGETLTGPIITIKDVAAMAGVSPATASRVLSGNPATSHEATAKVVAAAARLGYRPNAQARALRSTRTNVVGLLVSDVRNPFFADLAHAAEQAALSNGLVTLLGNANESIEQQDRYLDTFISQRVAGVVAAPQGEGSPSLKAVLERGIPTVFVDRTVDGIDIPSVTSDSDSGIRQAVEHLAGLGHKRVGYIAGPETTSTGRARLRSFSRAARDFGLSDDPDLTFVGDFQSASGAAGARHLLALPQRPTALLAADSPMAVGALSTLQHEGVHIGSDLALVAFDDLEWFPLLDTPLTVIAHDVETMGRTAVKLLLDVIDGHRPESVVLPSELIVRASTETPPKRQVL
ncbi:transcriptional regulator [Rhodococcus sp. WMMA185]|uniref:LacI family DNA-binding transcriptional regulator n=1 Tax=Rhodococcus sp. WMMA185 TaxID=679318 RepID=UPI00087A08FB|nr:LacI family DNA-binding transcriptional regulator [Rhodococcus sp. WMMA185]AOW92523.1 transcriptional regulator [Rhodococcus sp. WMMA185]